MKGRLFWKMFIGFWLTFAAISQGVTLLFTLFHYQPSLTDEQVARRTGPPLLELCALAIAREGPAACQALVARLAPDDLPRLEIRPVGVAPPSTRSDEPSVALRAAGPGGRAFDIHYHYAPPPPWPPTLLHLPFEVLLLGCIGGLTFSAILARYVIAPIRRVRRGFEELSRGNLSVRVGHTIGRRGDELTDLARHFDVMAGRLADLVAARDRFMHDVSHEIRSPLSRLQLAIALARQDVSRLPASLTRIEREARRLDHLVNELLTLARVESGVKTADEYFDLCGVVRTIIRDARFEAKSKGVEIRANLPKGDDRLPTVRGSSELIRRAIENVIRNALKFSPSGQAVTVEVCFDAAPRHYVVRVLDKGPGVAEHALAGLFEPFVKADDASAGFGLGLSIAQRALQAHGGRIQAANGERGGLHVTILLPAHEDHLLPAQETPAVQLG
jgi:two-component system OmpR family sensor kinase